MHVNIIQEYIKNAVFAEFQRQLGAKSTSSPRFPGWYQQWDSSVLSGRRADVLGDLALLDF